MLEQMSADEFVSWQAFERLEPFGFPWIDWIQAKLSALLDWQLHKKHKDDYLTQDDMRRKPPDPLFVTRARRVGAAWRERNERRSTKVRGP
jgi:hypothetical protein